MNEMLFTFPQIDPVAIALGPLQIRWYALAYVAGLIGGWWVLRRQIAAGLSVLDKDQLDGLMNACLVGILVGGRLGYVLFYNPSAYLAAPLDIVKVWQGGMSFHGGLSGVILAILWSARRYQLSPLSIGDEVALVAPLGLLFGRLANFINGELYGRVTDHPFGIVYPGGGPLPRHPSQLYEAGLEGIVLFGLLSLAIWKGRLLMKPGYITGLFLVGYGVCRALLENVREPDYGMPDFPLGLTMGMMLSIPMILVGLWLIWRARSRPPVVA